MRSRRFPSVSSTIDIRRMPVEVARIGVTHLLEEPVVDLVDDLKVTRQEALEESRRAHVSSASGISVWLVYQNVRCVIAHARSHVDVVDVDQQPHQLRDADGRMRVVELDGDLVGQFVEVRVRA